MSSERSILRVKIDGNETVVQIQKYHYDILISTYMESRNERKEKNIQLNTLKQYLTVNNLCRKNISFISFK